MEMVQKNFTRKVIAGEDFFILEFLEHPLGIVVQSFPYSLGPKYLISVMYIRFCTY